MPGPAVGEPGKIVIEGVGEEKEIDVHSRPNTPGFLFDAMMNRGSRGDQPQLPVLDYDGILERSIRLQLICVRCWYKYRVAGYTAVLQRGIC